MKNLKLIVILFSICACFCDKKNGGVNSKRRIKTAKCRYTFVVNEVDMTHCPNSLSQLQADKEPEESLTINPLLLKSFNTPPKVIENENSNDLKTWLNNMENQLYDELRKTNELNSTLSKHESILMKAENMLNGYESNFTAIFRMLRYMERSIQSHDEMSRHLDNKLSGVMLDVVEVNNVLSKKVVVGGQTQGYAHSKEVSVQSVSQVTACSTSPDVVVHRDCADVQRGHNVSGVYYVTLTFASCPIPVWCDMDTTLGGWLLILRRQNGRLSFKRLWNEYKHGFGNVVDEHYLGNDNIFLLTNQKHYEVRIDLWDFKGNRVYALYKTFKVEGERDNYRLHVHNFEGSARDAFKSHDRQMFSTPDRDNDGYRGYDCAKEWESGWWFNNCWSGFLTGPYYNISTVKYRGISWNEWKHEQLARAEMKIRPSRLTYGSSELQNEKNP